MATVADLYAQTLGRAPDAGGLAYWTQMFGSEVDPSEAATFKSVANVTEPEKVAAVSSGVAPTAAPAPSTTGDAPRATQVDKVGSFAPTAAVAPKTVNDLYQTFYGTPGNAEGLSYWGGADKAVNSKDTASWLHWAAKDPSIADKSTGITVDQAYQTYLGFKPDDAARNYWTGGDPNKELTTAELAAITSEHYKLNPDKGFHWNDLRDNLEAAAVIAGNYVLPGSSLVTSQLVTQGAQDALSTDAGKLANLAAGATGGVQGNMSNYGKVGETLGLTNPAQVTEAEFLAYDTAAQQAAMGNDFSAIQQNLIASGVDPLEAASIVQTLGTNPGITGLQLAELAGKTAASETLGSQIGSNVTNAAKAVGSGIGGAVSGGVGNSLLGNIGAATSIAAGINSLTGGGLTDLLGLGDKAPTAAEAQKMADPFSPYRAKLAEMYSGYLTGGNNTNIAQMPGYSQFESGVLNPALEATKRAGAKSGMLMSGNEQIALQKQGQTGYYNFMTDYLNRLATASGATTAPAQAANLGLAQGAANQQGIMQGIGGVGTGLAGLFGTNNTNVANTSSSTAGAGPTGYNWNLDSVDTSSWMG